MNKTQIIKWLEHERDEAHGAETFSRNGESTDYDAGVFAGREELAKELLVLLKK